MKKYTTRILVIALAMVLLSANINPARAGGDLDPGFGNGGKVLTDFSGSSETIIDIAIQPDGKIVAAGSVINASGVSDFALARYNPDGSLDSTFGAAGIITTDFFGKNDGAAGVVIQPDGKIVVAGVAGTESGISVFALARYNSDGSLDSSFGLGGKITYDFFGNNDAINAIAIQADGRIIAAGSAQDSSKISDFALIRIDPGLPGPPPPPADFGLRFNSPEVNAQRGTKVTLPVNIVRTGGHTGTVTITPPDTSALKIKVKPPAPVSTTGASASFKLKIKGGAPVGSHEITFTGRDDTGREHQATVRLVIQ